MSGKTIGLNLNNGYAGSYARQPDMIINTRSNVGSAAVSFGTALIQATGGVKAADATSTAATFAGVAARQLQSQTSYLSQAGAGTYAVSAPVSVFQRGRINVICHGTSALYGAVYLRVVAATGKAIGDFEVAADSTNNILLTNCEWGGAPDANGVSELVILSTVSA